MASRTPGPSCRLLLRLRAERKDPRPHLLTGLQHLPQHAHESPILHCSRHPLLVTQLLVYLLPGTMRTLLDPDIDSKPWRQGLLETHSHAQPDDCRKRTMRYRRRYQNRHGVERRGGGEAADMDVR